MSIKGNFCMTRVGILCLLSLSFLVGCSNGNFPVKPVHGRVLCNGQPVTSGSISFSPVGAGTLESGKPASGAIAKDGTFKLSTYDRFDGAIVGKHRVEYVGSEGEESEEDGNTESAPTKKSKVEKTVSCVQKGPITLEVKATGENVFEIELTKSTE